MARLGARSTKEALEALERGVDVPMEALDTPTPQEGALGVLIEEIRAQRHEISTLRQEVSELRQQLKALEPPEADKAGYAVKIEQMLGELERRNRYLKGELDRRDAEAVKVKRPWWRWWR